MNLCILLFFVAAASAWRTIQDLFPVPTYPELYTRQLVDPPSLNGAALEEKMNATTEVVIQWLRSNNAAAALENARMVGVEEYIEQFFILEAILFSYAYSLTTANFIGYGLSQTGTEQLGNELAKLRNVREALIQNEVTQEMVNNMELDPLYSELILTEMIAIVSQKARELQLDASLLKSIRDAEKIVDRVLGFYHPKKAFFYVHEPIFSDICTRYTYNRTAFEDLVYNSNADNITKVMEAWKQNPFWHSSHVLNEARLHDVEEVFHTYFLRECFLYTDSFVAHASSDMEGISQGEYYRKYTNQYLLHGQFQNYVHKLPELVVDEFEAKVFNYSIPVEGGKVRIGRRLFSSATQQTHKSRRNSLPANLRAILEESYPFKMSPSTTTAVPSSSVPGGGPYSPIVPKQPVIVLPSTTSSAPWIHFNGTVSSTAVPSTADPSTWMPTSVPPTQVTSTSPRIVVPPSTTSFLDWLTSTSTVFPTTVPSTVSTTTAQSSTSSPSEPVVTTFPTIANTDYFYLDFE